MKTIRGLPIAFCLFILTSLATSAWLPLLRSPGKQSNDLVSRSNPTCPKLCTDCPNGKFQPTAGNDGGTAGYTCSTACSPPSGSYVNFCTPPSGCTPATGSTPPSPPPPATANVWCPTYCTQCGYGQYTSSLGQDGTSLTFTCADPGPNCGGTEGGNNAAACIPPMPSTCPVPKAASGWCTAQIVQYQKNSCEGSKNAGSEWFMYDVVTYDNDGWLMSVIGGLVVPTNQSRDVPIPQLGKPLQIISSVHDLDGIQLKYAGEKWDTGTYIGTDSSKWKKNPHFSENGEYATPDTFGRDAAGQRVCHTGWTC